MAHTLPPLTAVEQAHSKQLAALIRDEILHAGGWISFARYMQQALYAPGLGYYSAGAHKLGSGGDFTTAPEISPLFSRCVANQCAAVLQSLHGDVLELGAGTGVMAAEILLQLEHLNALPTHYSILEVSADLQARQRALLQQRVPHLFHRVQWLQQVPATFKGIIVANEVLDAMPIERFCILNGEVQALGVKCDGEQFTWQTQIATPELAQAVLQIESERGKSFASDYCSEINLQLPAWLQSLADALQQGVILFTDYGLPQREYYSDERTQGTLACFHKHHIHGNPFAHVGLQDITAWVDFTALAAAGVAAGLELQGFATQAHFLLGAGITQLLQGTHETMNDAQRWQLSQQVQKLTMPGEMGESFKAMAFSKSCDIQLSGFAFRDLRERL